MKALIKSLDLFGNKVKLKIHDSSRYKTLTGGILGVLALSLIASASIFFTLKFFNRDESTSISDLVATNQVSVDFHKVPFMIRVSDSYSRVLEDKERVWKVALKTWYGGLNETDNKMTQSTHDIPVEICDINKHFGEYKHLFVNFTDISTYYCPNFGDNNETIYGLYGDTQPFTYHNYYIYKCKNNCRDEAFIQQSMMSIYIDTRTIDYTTSSIGMPPNTMFVRSDRHASSISVYKRIWMYVQSVDYSIDAGYIFPEILNHNYYQFENFRYDVDVRNHSTATVPETFTSLTILNFPRKLNQHRSYMKAQNLLANIGGIIKGLMVIVSVMNYILTNKFYALKLINSNNELMKDMKELVHHDDSAIHSMIPRKSMTHILKNNNYLNKNNNSSKTITPANDRFESGRVASKMKKSDNVEELPSYKSKVDLQAPDQNSNINMIKSFNNEQTHRKDIFSLFKTIYTYKKYKMKMTWKEHLLPLYCLPESKKKKLFIDGTQMMNNRISILYVIKKMGEVEKLKYLLLDKDQNALFNVLPIEQDKGQLRKIKTTYNENTMLNSYNAIFGKESKSDVDDRILRLFL